MVTTDIHALAEVKPVCIESLNPRIQIQHRATMVLCASHEPAKHRPSVALRAGGGVGDQIIDVEVFAVEQTFGNSESGHAADVLCFLQEGERIAGVLLLAPNAAQEFHLNQMGPELKHQRKTPLDLRISRGDNDVGRHGRCAGLGTQSIRRLVNSP